MQVTYAKRSGVSMFAGNGTWTEIVGFDTRKKLTAKGFS